MNYQLYYYYAYNIIRPLSKYLFTRCWFDFLVFFPFFVFFFLFFHSGWGGIRCRFSYNFRDFLLVLNPRSMKNVMFSYFSWNKSSVITQQLLLFQPIESLKSTTSTVQDKRIIYIVSQQCGISNRTLWLVTQSPLLLCYRYTGLRDKPLNLLVSQENLSFHSSPRSLP